MNTRDDLRVTTVSDVGTPLAAITTAMSASRIVRPCELVRLRAAEYGRGFSAP